MATSYLKAQTQRERHRQSDDDVGQYSQQKAAEAVLNDRRFIYNISSIAASLATSILIVVVYSFLLSAQCISIIRQIVESVCQCVS